MKKSNPKPERHEVDTGEYIVPELGYQRALTFAKRQGDRITELETAVLEMARYIHSRLHPPAENFDKCRYTACRKARHVLGF